MSKGLKTFAIYETATGRLISHETDDAVRLTDAELAANGMSRTEVPDQLKAGLTWNPITRTQVPIPPDTKEVDRASLVAKPTATWTDTDKASAKTLLQAVKF